jgi:hypothetical protein
MKLEIRGLDEHLHIAPCVTREQVRAANGGGHERSEQEE